jgi:hypothetical protein
VQVNTQVNVDINTAVREILAAIQPNAGALTSLESIVDGE